MTTPEVVRPQENPAFIRGMDKFTRIVRTYPEIITASAARYPAYVVVDPSTVEIGLTPDVGMGHHEGYLIFSPHIMIDPLTPVSFRVDKQHPDETTQIAVAAAIWGLNVPEEDLNVTADERIAIVLAGMDILMKQTQQRLIDIATDVSNESYSDKDAEKYRTPLIRILGLVEAQRASVEAGTAIYDLEPQTASLIVLPVDSK